MKEKILIVRFSSLGDVILTSPLPINIKVNNPDTYITYLTKEKFRPIVEMMPGVDEIISIPDGIGAGSFLKFLIKLDNKNYNTIIDLHRNNRSWLTGKILTYDKLLKYPKLTRDIVIKKEQESLAEYIHTIDCYNDCLKDLDYNVYCHRPQLRVGKTENSILTDFIDQEKDYIVIAPEAAHETKAYDWDKYQEIAFKAVNLFNTKVAWLTTSASSNKTINNDLKELGDFREFVDLPIKDLAYLVKNSRMSLTNDSGLMHLSSAFNRPVVALFGPTHRKLGFYPRGLFDSVLEVDEYCRPCSKHGSKPCFREERFCFNRINQEDILRAIEEKLDLTRSLKQALFIDRDGTLIKEKHFLSDPDEVEIYEKADDTIKLAKELGYKIIMISNQSGVARGKFGLDIVEKVNGRIEELLSAKHVELDGYYFCPHHPKGSINAFSKKCSCRKPGVDMAEEASIQLGVDLTKSIMVGDKLDDVNFGKVFGGDSVLVRTGYGDKNEQKLSTEFYNDVSICDTISEVAAILKEKAVK